MRPVAGARPSMTEAKARLKPSSMEVRGVRPGHQVEERAVRIRAQIDSLRDERLPDADLASQKGCSEQRREANPKACLWRQGYREPPSKHLQRHAARQQNEAIRYQKSRNADGTPIGCAARPDDVSTAEPGKQHDD